MIRLLLRLFGIRDFEVCQSCETLKKQLEYERSERHQLTDTLLAIVNPKVVEQQTPVELNPIVQSTGSWARRRAALEVKDREEARILKMSSNVAKPDNVVKDNSILGLEQELGIEEKVGEA